MFANLSSKPVQYKTETALATVAAAAIMAKAKDAIQTRGVFHIALSGGSSPLKTYSLLAEQADPSWSHWHIWFGDERCVPVTSEESNYYHALDTLLSRIPIPQDQIHPMYPDISQTPESAAMSYQQILQEYVPTPHEFPVFDLILLGMGQDGHVASLFPGTPALLEKKKWVIPNLAPNEPRQRLTLSLPVLNHARCIMFIINGAGKSSVLSQLNTTDPKGSEHPLPIQLVKPATPSQWFIYKP